MGFLPDSPCCLRVVSALPGGTAGDYALDSCELVAGAVTHIGRGSSALIKRDAEKALMTTVNRKITIASLPVGLPKVSDFRLVYAPLPSPANGEVLVRSIYLGLEPDLRRGMSTSGLDPQPVAVGEVMAGDAVAFVVASEDPAFRAGDAVLGRLGWQEFAVAKGRDLRKIDPIVAPLSTALGVLGLPGLTALFGLEICDPRRGETVVVSCATGGVGMLAGQIAKIKGCRVVGMVAPDVEASWLLDELGFDAALANQVATDFRGRLGKACPDGIDVYFDNVGGVTTDEVMGLLNTRARISLCGQSSQDNLETPEVGPRCLSLLMVKQAKMVGFLVAGHADRFPEGLERLAGWLKQGRLQNPEDVAHGIAAAPQAFIAMLEGKNRGQQLVRLAES